MVTLPPPTAPQTLPTQAVPPASIPVTLDVINITNTVAALQQRVVVQVLAIEVNLTEHLLLLTTPQGKVSLQLPQPGAPGSMVTLPNGQAVPLQTLLQSANATDIKQGFLLQLDPKLPLPSGAQQQPAARLLLAPDILANIKPGTPIPAPAGQTPTPTGPIRTDAIPVPQGSYTPLPTFGAAATAQVQTNITARIMAAVQNVLTQNAPPVPTQAGNISTPAPTLQNVAPTMRTVDVFTSPQPGATPATIVGNTPRGDIVVRTQSGETLALPHIRPQPIAPGALPAPGGTLYIKPAPTHLPGAPADEPSLPPALHALLDALETANPALAARVAQQSVLPLHTHSGPQVAGTMLFFLSALTGNTIASNPQAALHQQIQKLLPKNIQTDALEEMKAMTRRVADGDSGMGNFEWRGYQLPAPNVDGLQGPVWLYVHQRRQNDEEKSPQQDGIAPTQPKQTRFVIDLQLSKLGHTQLEGIAKQNQIDLKLNTPAPMPREMEAELIGLYKNIASAYGFAGDLLFTSGTLIELRQSSAKALI